MHQNSKSKYSLDIQEREEKIKVFLKIILILNVKDENKSGWFSKKNLYNPVRKKT